MQAETISLADKAIEQAPILAITLIVSVGGVLLISKLFLASWARTEETRVKTMDARHSQYFDQLETNNRAMVQAMDRGTAALENATVAQRESTEVLGGVRELLRERP